MSKPSSVRQVFAWATDPRIVRWQVSSLVLIVYVALWLRVVFYPTNGRPSLYSVFVVFFIFVVQWFLLWLTYRVFLNRAWWRWHAAVSTLVVVVITVLATGLIAALVSSMAVSSAPEFLGAESPAMWGQRVLALLVITAAWSVFDDYRRSLISERELQALLENTLQAGVTSVEQQRNEVVEKVQQMLDEALDEAQRGRNASATFHHFARERLRPLSHELIKALPRFTPIAPQIKKTSEWRAIGDAISSGPIIRPFLMAITVTFFFMWRTTSIGLPQSGETAVDSSSIDPGRTGLAIQVDTASLALSLSYLLGVFAGTWIIGLLIVHLSRRILPTLKTGPRLVFLISTPLVMAIIVEGLLQFIYFLVGQSENLPSSFAQRLAFAVPIFLIALVILGARGLVALLNSAQANQHMITNRLEWEVARTNETIIQERKYLASQLHGPLQSMVSALAMKIENQSIRGVLDDKSISESQEQLSRAIADLSEGPKERPRIQEHLENIASTWKGLCEVDFDMPENVARNIDHDWVCSATVAEILTDAVANAVMHGKANKVSSSINVTPEQGCVLEVMDNGLPSQEIGKPGLGTLHLDELAVRWERNRNPSGTSLLVVLPVDMQSNIAEKSF